MGWETSGQAETRSQLTCIQCLRFLSTPSFSRLGQAGASHTLTVSLLPRVPLPHVTEKQMETQVWSHSVVTGLASNLDWSPGIPHCLAGTLPARTNTSKKMMEGAREPGGGGSVSSEGMVTPPGGGAKFKWAQVFHLFIDGADLLVLKPVF